MGVIPMSISLKDDLNDMTYNKQQLRDFFNHLFLELQGQDSEQLQTLRQKYGIELIPPTTDMDKLEYQEALLTSFKVLIPLFKGLTDRMAESKPRAGTEKIAKTFSRVMKTAEYENVQVSVTVEREIEFQTAEERAEQVDAMRRQAAEELADDLRAACEKLGVSDKRVLVRR